MTKKCKYFGTDGIRGRVGEPGSAMNPEFILKLAWAIGTVFKKKTKKFDGGTGKILVGKDTRISGYLLESLLEAGLSSAGINTHLLGPMPTPAIAYLTRTFRAQAGIVISASHNPYYDNGIKVFSDAGTKLPADIEHEIEEVFAKTMHMVPPAELGKAKRLVDAPGRYIEFCKSTIGLNNTLAGIKLVIDCANGATYQVAPAIFRELGAEIIEINTDPDGFNINENCGSTHPQIIAKIVKAESADLGIAFDGDGDRVIMVDNKGEVVDGDELLFIMAKHAFTKGYLRKESNDGIVGTVMSNLGLELAIKELGLNFKRVKVGDRYVIEGLKEEGWLIGGEQSGHIVHLGITTTGDGIISALQVLAAMADRGRSLHELKSEMKKFPQQLINVKLTQPIDLDNNPTITKAVSHAEQKLGKTGRLLLRKSGTEPLIRIMVEGENQQSVDKIASELAEIIKKCMLTG
jgi:phosphoglucosamine mutase